MMMVLLLAQLPTLRDSEGQFAALRSILRERPSVYFSYWKNEKQKAGGYDSANIVFCIDKQGRLSKEIRVPEVFDEIRVSPDYRMIGAVVRVIAEERIHGGIIGAPPMDPIFMVADRKRKLYQKTEQSFVLDFYWKGSTLRVAGQDERMISAAPSATEWKIQPVKSPFKRREFRYLQPPEAGNYLTWKETQRDWVDYRLTSAGKTFPLNVRQVVDMVAATGTPYFFYKERGTDVIFRLDTSSCKSVKLNLGKSNEIAWLPGSKMLTFTPEKKPQLGFYSPLTGKSRFVDFPDRYISSVIELNDHDVVVMTQEPYYGRNPEISVVDSRTCRVRILKRIKSDVPSVSLMSCFRESH